MNAWCDQSLVDQQRNQFGGRKFGKFCGKVTVWYKKYSLAHQIHQSFIIYSMYINSYFIKSSYTCIQLPLIVMISQTSSVLTLYYNVNGV